MSKIIFAVTIMLSAVSFAEEMHNFPSVNARDYSCVQLQQGIQNRGFTCVQSDWFKDWCTMHLATPNQCDSSQKPNPAYVSSKDGSCFLGWVCERRGGDGGTN